MSGLIGGQGAAGAYSNMGGNATVYNPTGQGYADNQYQALLSSLANEYYGGGMPAQAGYRQGQGIQRNIQNYADLMGTANPYAYLGMDAARSLVGAGQGVGQQALNNASTLGTYGNQILNTAFDPQGALYQRMAGQTADRANAINSMYGLGSSPYGAGLANDASRNFNIDWQNNLLNRQATGLGSAGNAFGQSLGLGQGGLNTYYTASNLPYNTYENQLLQGQQGQQNALNALQQNTQIGQSQYSLPTSLLASLAQYLGLGQSASGISGQLGNLGFQQGAQSASGLGQLFGLGSNFLSTLFL